MKRHPIIINNINILRLFCPAMTLPDASFRPVFQANESCPFGPPFNNVDAIGSEGRRRPPQPSREYMRRTRPLLRPLHPLVCQSLEVVEQLSRRPLPILPAFHERPDRRPDKVGVERHRRHLAPIHRIGRHECPRCPAEGFFACSDPGREIRHSWVCVHFHCWQPAEGCRRRVEQGPEDARSVVLEVCPQVLLRQPPLLRDRCQVQDYGTVGKVVPADDVRDPVHYDGTHGIENGFLVVREQRPSREPAARTHPAQGVRHGPRYGADVVIGQKPRVISGDCQVANRVGHRPARSDPVIDEGLQHPHRRRLRGALLAGQAKNGIRAPWAEAPQQESHEQDEIVGVFQVDVPAQGVHRPAPHWMRQPAHARGPPEPHGILPSENLPAVGCHADDVVPLAAQVYINTALVAGEPDEHLPALPAVQRVALEDPDGILQDLPADALLVLLPIGSCERRPETL